MTLLKITFFFQNALVLSIKFEDNLNRLKIIYNEHNGYYIIDYFKEEETLFNTGILKDSSIFIYNHFCAVYHIAACFWVVWTAFKASFTINSAIRSCQLSLKYILFVCVTCVIPVLYLSFILIITEIYLNQIHADCYK